MYNTSKYYSYIFYADRNIRPWTILGYSFATFPKVVQYIYLCTTQEEIRTLAQLQEKGPCIIGGESGHQIFYTAKEKLNKDKEGRNSQPSKHQEKDNTKLCIIFLFYI